jgi:hypothetical protein
MTPGEAFWLLAAVPSLVMGLVLPLRGFFRLGAMRAMERRRQSATLPIACLVVMSAIFLVDSIRGAIPSLLTIFGVVANGLWLWVVRTRGRPMERQEGGPPIR